MAKSAITPIGVLCFADQIFKARANQNNPNQKPRYSAMLLFDDLGIQTKAYQDLRTIVQEAAAEKFGAAKAQDPAFMRGLRLPFRSADEKEYDGFENGKIYISAWSENAPDVVDLHGNKIITPTDVWSGQLARASVRAFAYDSNGNRGVSFGLEHVQIVKMDMPRIDGRRSASQAFATPAEDDQMKALGIDASASAPTTGDLPW